MGRVAGDVDRDGGFDPVPRSPSAPPDRPGTGEEVSGRVSERLEAWDQVRTGVEPADETEIGEWSYSSPGITSSDRSAKACSERSR